MKALAAWLVALSVLVGSAPVAHADDAADFLAFLDKDQIAYSNPATAVNMGNGICQQLRSNPDPGSVLDPVFNAGYSGRQAGLIVFAATRTLCPDMAPVVDKWPNSP